MSLRIPYYQSPEEGAQASSDMTDKALGAVIAMLTQYLYDKQALRAQLDETDDAGVIALLEGELKLIRNEEQSLQKILSGLQSRLSAAKAGL